MTADAPGRVGRRTGTTGTFGTAAIRRRLAANRDFGPFDAEDLDPSLPGPPGLLDFGSIRVPVPADGTVTVEPTANGRLQAVHVALPGGRLSVSALAAPKSSGLWAELVAEIDSSLRDGGARVRSFQGEWGRELHARTGAATSVFVGVDGARWMLYGVATGPERHAVGLEAALRQMLKGTVVDRGRSPFPVRTVLPLSVPDELAGSEVVDDSAAGVPGPPPAPTAASPAAPFPAAPAGRGPVVPVRAPAPVVPRRIDEPTEIRPVAFPPAAPAPAAGDPLRVPAATHPPADPHPPLSGPAPDPTHALPVSRPPSRPVPPRAEPPVPLWATPASELGTSDLGRDPLDGVGPEPLTASEAPVTEWWPTLAPAEPEPRHDVDPWAPSESRAPSDSWVASTPLHDELVHPPTERWAAVEPVEPAPARSPLDPWAVGFVDGGSGGARPPADAAAAPDRPARDVPVDDRWSVERYVEDPYAEDRYTEDRLPEDRRPEDRLPEDRRPEDRRPEDRRPEDRRPGGARETARAARHAAPADAVPRSGRRRRAEEPGEGAAGSTLDLAALVRERPGRRRSRHGSDEPLRGTDRRRDDAGHRAPDGADAWAPAPDRPGYDGTADDDRWGAENHGLPNRSRYPDADLWAPAGRDPDPASGRDTVGWRAGRRAADERHVDHGVADGWSGEGWTADRPGPVDRPAPDTWGADRRATDRPAAGRRRADRWDADRGGDDRPAGGARDGGRRESDHRESDHRESDRREDERHGRDRWDGDRWPPAPSDHEGGRRRRPEPEFASPDRRGPVTDPSAAGESRSGRRRAPEADPATDPLPAYPGGPDLPRRDAPPPGSSRRRRSVDVPPDPDWVHPALRAGRVRDGSAPALAFLAEPEPGPEPDPPPGRHHRPR